MICVLFMEVIAAKYLHARPVHFCMIFKRPFDVDQRRMEILSGIVSRYYGGTKDRFPVPGKWRSMGDEDLWKHLIRIIIAAGKSAPSYNLVNSDDFRHFTIKEMKRYQSLHGTDGLITNIHRIMAGYNVRYCSPLKDRSIKAAAIVNNLNNPVIIEDTKFRLMDRIADFRNDPRFYIIDNVEMYGMNSSSEFLIEVGYTKDYMALDTRLRRVFSIVFDKDFRKAISTKDEYLRFEQEFRDEICPKLNVKPAELDSIIFWNYDSILKDLKSLHSYFYNK